MPSDAHDGTRGPRCPVCGKPTEAAMRPFCSKRCADVDLSRWLGGAYAVAGHADTEEDGGDGAPADTTLPRQDD